MMSVPWHEETEMDVGPASEDIVEIHMEVDDLNVTPHVWLEAYDTPM